MYNVFRYKICYDYCQLHGVIRCIIYMFACMYIYIWTYMYRSDITVVGDRVSEDEDLGTYRTRADIFFHKKILFS